MKKLVAFIMILSLCIGCFSGCSKKKSKAEELGVDVASILENQKILFIMTKIYYSDRYASGYFIDNEGNKRRFDAGDHVPKTSDEETYEYLLLHLDDFEKEEFWTQEELENAIVDLYLLNEDAEIVVEGCTMADCTTDTMRGVRMDDDQVNIVFLQQYDGQSKTLDDTYAQDLYELMGEDWKRGPVNPNHNW